VPIRAFRAFPVSSQPSGAKDLRANYRYIGTKTLGWSEAKMNKPKRHVDASKVDNLFLFCAPIMAVQL
jgi:hypothetical protein